MNDPAADPVETITRVAAGLLVPSESEYPFTPFRWDGGTPIAPTTLVAALGLPPGTPVETGSLDDFFRPLARNADWMDPAQHAMAARFATLRDTIAITLTEIDVYRVGRVQVHIIIAGRTTEGAIGGLRTLLIET